jgi:dihydropteroate synthase
MIAMHMLGTPKTMQQEIRYENFPQDVRDFLWERVCFLEDAGIAPNKTMVDPGVGFGKTFDQNLILINRLDMFKSLERPVVLGASRKAFLGKILDEHVAANRDTGTLAVTATGVLKGAAMIRVHDVPATVQVCRVADAIVRESVGS